MKPIYCCGCRKLVKPRLTSGKEIYPHRKDLHHLPFWRCNTCGNFVGCHHKTGKGTRPLGTIATPEIREWRKKIHELLDPMWKNGMLKRDEIYARLSASMGRTYHTGDVNTQEEAEAVIHRLIEMNGSTT